MKIVANKDSFGFQDRGWIKGDIAIVKDANFPEAKHFNNLDGSPLVEAKKEEKKEEVKPKK